METTTAIQRVANGLKKLTTSTSSHIGTDCWEHATLAHKVLSEMGIETQIVAGAAAWRIGPGFSDVISHLLDGGLHEFKGMRALAYHAWLKYQDDVLDFSTHALALKAKQLDALDGGKTTVEWCPDYLQLPAAQVKTLQEVAESDSPGLAYYEEVPNLYTYLKDQGYVNEMDTVDLAALRMLIANPDMKVFGPNDAAVLMQSRSGSVSQLGSSSVV